MAKVFNRFIAVTVLVFALLVCSPFRTADGADRDEPVEGLRFRFARPVDPAHEVLTISADPDARPAVVPLHRGVLACPVARIWAMSTGPSTRLWAVLSPSAAGYDAARVRFISLYGPDGADRGLAGQEPVLAGARALALDAPGTLPLAVGAAFRLDMEVDGQRWALGGFVSAAPPLALVSAEREDAAGRLICLRFNTTVSTASASLRTAFSSDAGAPPRLAWQVGPDAVRLLFDEPTPTVSVSGLQSEAGAPLLPVSSYPVSTARTATLRVPGLAACAATAVPGADNDVITIRFTVPLAPPMATDPRRYRVRTGQEPSAVHPRSVVWRDEACEAQLALGPTALLVHRNIEVTVDSVVGMDGGEARELSATALVEGDETPPTVVDAAQNVAVDPLGCTVDVQFSEAIDDRSCADPALFSATPNVRAVDVRRVAPDTVRVVWDGPVMAGQSAVVVRGAIDLAGNAMPRPGRRTIVVRDQAPPRVVRVEAIAVPGAMNDRILVYYSRPMLRADAVDAAMFRLEMSGGGAARTLPESRLRYLPNGPATEIILSGREGPDLKTGAAFALHIGPLRDPTGTRMVPLRIEGRVIGDERAPQAVQTVRNTLVDPSGRTLDASFDESLDADTVSLGAVSSPGGPRPVSVRLLSDRQTVRIGFERPPRGASWNAPAIAIEALLAILLGGLVFSAPRRSILGARLARLLGLCLVSVLVVLPVRHPLRSPGETLRFAGIRDLAGNLAPPIEVSDFDELVPTPLTVAGVSARADALALRFSRPVDVARAMDPRCYTLDIETEREGEMTLTPVDLSTASIRCDPDGDTVEIRLGRNLPPTTGTPTGFMATVSQVQDIHGNRVLTGQRILGAFPPAAAPPVLLSCATATESELVQWRREGNLPTGAQADRARFALLRFNEALTGPSARAREHYLAPGGPATEWAVPGADGKSVLVCFRGPVAPGETRLVVRDLETASGVRMPVAATAWVLDGRTGPDPEVVSVTAASEAGTDAGVILLRFSSPMLAAAVEDPAAYLLAAGEGDRRRLLRLSGSALCCGADQSPATLHYDASAKTLAIRVSTRFPRAGERLDVTVDDLLDTRRRRLTGDRHVATIVGERPAPSDLFRAEVRNDLDATGRTVDICTARPLSYSSVPLGRLSDGAIAPAVMRLPVAAEPPAGRDEAPQRTPPTGTADLRRSWSALASLGSRMPGTPGNVRARNLLVSELAKMGYTPIVEPVSVVVPIETPEQSRLEVLAGATDGPAVSFPISCIWPNGPRGIALPNGGLRAPIVDIGRGTFREMNGRAIEGAVVLLDFDTGSRYLDAVAMGARAVIFADHGMVTRSEAESKYLSAPADIPRFWIGRKAAQDLRALLGAGRSSEAAIHASLEWKRVETWNIYALAEGSDAPPAAVEADPEQPWVRPCRVASGAGQSRCRLIIVGAWYDSSSIVPAVAPGADSACGAAAFLELARALAADRRGCSVLLFASGSHFIGLSGAAEFADRLSRGSAPFQGREELQGRTPCPPRTPLAFLGLDLSSGADTLTLLPESGADQAVLGALVGKVAESHPALSLPELPVGEVRPPGLAAPAAPLPAVNPALFPAFDLLPDARAFSSAGIPAFTLVTTNDARSAWDTPADTAAATEPERLANLQRQVDAAVRAVQAVALAPELGALRRTLTPAGRLGGTVWAGGAYRSRVPVGGALVSCRPDGPPVAAGVRRVRRVFSSEVETRGGDAATGWRVDPLDPAARCLRVTVWLQPGLRPDFGRVLVASDGGLFSYPLVGPDAQGRWEAVIRSAPVCFGRRSLFLITLAGAAVVLAGLAAARRRRGSLVRRMAGRAVSAAAVPATAAWWLFVLFGQPCQRISGPELPPRAGSEPHIRRIVMGGPALRLSLAQDTPIGPQRFAGRFMFSTLRGENVFDLSAWVPSADAESVAVGARRVRTAGAASGPASDVRISLPVAACRPVTIPLPLDPRTGAPFVCTVLAGGRISVINHARPVEFSDRGVSVLCLPRGSAPILSLSSPGLPGRLEADAASGAARESVGGRQTVWSWLSRDAAQRLAADNEQRLAVFGACGLSVARTRRSQRLARESADAAAEALKAADMAEAARATASALMEGMHVQAALDAAERRLILTLMVLAALLGPAGRIFERRFLRCRSRACACLAVLSASVLILAPFAGAMAALVLNAAIEPAAAWKLAGVVAVAIVSTLAFRLPEASRAPGSAAEAMRAASAAAWRLGLDGRLEPRRGAVAGAAAFAVVGLAVLFAGSRPARPVPAVALRPGSPGYSGVLLRLGSDIEGLRAESIIGAEFGDAARMVRRAVLLPPAGGAIRCESSGSGRPTQTRLARVVGLSVEESQATGADRWLVGGRSRWFHPGETDAVLLPRGLADALELTTRDVGRATVSLLGVRLRVIGILDDSRAGRLTDIDGRALFDPRSPNAAAGPAGDAVVPYATALGLGGRPESVALVDWLTPDFAIRAGDYAASADTSIPVAQGGRAEVRSAPRRGPAAWGSLGPAVIAGSILLVLLSVGRTVSRRDGLSACARLGLAPRHLARIAAGGVLADGLVGLVASLAAFGAASVAARHCALPQATYSLPTVRALAWAGVLLVGLPPLAALIAAHGMARREPATVRDAWHITALPGQTVRVLLPFTLDSSEAASFLGFLLHELSLLRDPAAGPLLLSRLQYAKGVDRRGSYPYISAVLLAGAGRPTGVKLRLEAQRDRQHNVFRFEAALAALSPARPVSRPVAEAVLQRLHGWWVQWQRLPLAKHATYRAIARRLIRTAKGPSNESQLQ